ncbi:unnamed protein product, partial [Ceratitis capitata]
TYFRSQKGRSFIQAQPMFHVEVAIRLRVVIIKEKLERVSYSITGDKSRETFLICLYDRTDMSLDTVKKDLAHFTSIT